MYKRSDQRRHLCVESQMPPLRSEASRGSHLPGRQRRKIWLKRNKKQTADMHKIRLCNPKVFHHCKSKDRDRETIPNQMDIDRGWNR